VCICMKYLALFFGSTGHPFIDSCRPILAKKSLLHKVKCLLTDHSFLDSNSRDHDRRKSASCLYWVSFIKKMEVVFTIVVWVLSE
jgi:hypothetical protein